ncbi:uncharacterized protein LOC130894577 isoform X1 [Diorhabda carinulata]|uniref:uncharacterized protein LOC130894577 isoform X1 n=1 Tax=Diorhabda carinulata TaxID=1163345 RepID=UPI0025A1AD46|nr:uncharacterized protein LOC130894577 isoform X1 [Diorhabda carinulata]
MSGYEDRDSDYEDADKEIFSSSFKPSYVVIGIDNHSSMFEKNLNGITPFRMCLKACHNLAENLLFRKDARSWSHFAILISGISKPLTTFSENVVDVIKMLKATSDLSDDALSQEYQRKGNLDLSSFFLSGKKLFHEVKTVFYKRTFLYMSNDDNPVKDKNSKFTAFNEIKTFAGSQIQFQVIPTVPSFNYKLFYNEVFNLLGGLNEEEICTDTEGLTQKLSSTILVNINKRKLNFYPFKGDTTRFLKCLRLYIYSNIQLYNNYMTKDGQKVINTSRQSDTPVYYRIKYISSDKAPNVKFDIDEKDRLMDFDTPKGLILCYVADRQVGIGHIFTSPNLIRADPKEDLPYFNKFWDNCVATNKVLVCTSKMRQPDKIRCVELIPVLVDGIQMFLEKVLPFGNEIILPQKLNYPIEEVNEERKEAVRKLVDKLTFDFEPNMITDIQFQKKKAYIRAKLLNEPIIPVNDIQIDPQALDSVLDEVITEIKEKFDLKETEKKRGRSSSSQRSRNKRFK